MNMIKQNFGRLNIVVAVYGLKTVTEHIKNLIVNGLPQTLNITVNNPTIGEDGWPGQRKSLMILYNYDDGNLQVAAAKEGDVITINPYTFKTTEPLYSDAVTRNHGLEVLAATYGAEDVTGKVRKMISAYNTLSFKVDNTVFKDPWYGVAKTLVVILGADNEVRSVEVFAERESCYIDLSDAIPAL